LISNLARSNLPTRLIMGIQGYRWALEASTPAAAPGEGDTGVVLRSGVRRRPVATLPG
jgi:hypothetical protein